MFNMNLRFNKPYRWCWCYENYWFKIWANHSEWRCFPRCSGSNRIYIFPSSKSLNIGRQHRSMVPWIHVTLIQWPSCCVILRMLETGSPTCRYISAWKSGRDHGTIGESNICSSKEKPVDLTEFITWSLLFNSHEVLNRHLFLVDTSIPGVSSRTRPPSLWFDYCWHVNSRLVIPVVL